SFACRNRGKGNFGMRTGDGEVDGNLNLWISQQFLYGTHFGNAEFLCLSSCSLHINIRASDDLQIIKEVGRFEINGADVATSDDANGRFSVHTRTKTSFLTMCRAFRRMRYYSC